MTVSAGLRIYDLASQSLWHDEAFSWRISQLPWVEIVRRTAEDVHPPLYYFLLKGWMLVLGDSVFAMRLFSAVTDLVVIYCLYRFSESLYARDEVGGRPAIGGLAASLAGLSVFRILQAREVRMYPLGNLLTVTSSWVLWEALRGDRQSPGRWALFAALATGLVYTHNYGLFTVAAQGLFALGFLGRAILRGDETFLRSRRVFSAVLAFAAVFAAYGPWASVLWEQRSRVVEAYWIPWLTFESVNAAIEQTITGASPTEPAMAGGLATVAVASVLILFAATGRRAADAYVFLLAVVPLGLALGISAVQDRNILVGKYLSFSVPFFLVVVSSLIDRSGRRWVLAAVLTAGLAFQDVSTWSRVDPWRKPGLRAAAAMVAADYRDGDRVIAYDTGTFLGLRYYLRGRIASFYLVGSAKEPRNQGEAVVFESDRVTARQLAVQNAPRTWIVSADASMHKDYLVPEGWAPEGRWSFPDCVPFRRKVDLRRLIPSAVDRAPAQVAPGMIRPSPEGLTERSRRADRRTAMPSWG
jgi:mannosyltransferase